MLCRCPGWRPRGRRRVLPLKTAANGSSPSMHIHIEKLIENQQKGMFMCCADAQAGCPHGRRGSATHYVLQPMVPHPLRVYAADRSSAARVGCLPVGRSQSSVPVSCLPLSTPLSTSLSWVNEVLYMRVSTASASCTNVYMQPFTACFRLSCTTVYMQPFTACFQLPANMDVQEQSFIACC